MAYRVGIDAGSKTIKIVVLDEEGSVVYSLYRRHRSDIRTTLVDVLHDVNWRYGDVEGTVAVTGSAGIALAELMGLPFVQEVIATTAAVRDRYPQADCVIELGGEDAKVIYLTGGLEQRMNATCAGGTGGFIDTIAHMIGSRTRDISRLALGASRVYPIASRCAVFAQSDVRPLMNAGAKKSDIAASVLEAVVRQTLGGLACGRPITGTVVFLGGPIEKVPYLVLAYRRALGLDASTGIKPPQAHLMTALGAALYAGEHGGARVSLADLECRAREAPAAPDDMPHKPPLFESEQERAAFMARHQDEKVPRATMNQAEGPLYLGVDAGSTAVKCVLINDAGSIVYADYRAVSGDVLKACASMVEGLEGALPRYIRAESERPFVSHATATGYGERLLRAGLGIDSGVVETTAHVRAAREFRPEVSFVLDIGGQDMKALWVRDGRVADAVLNEACSSGCGSFVEGTAHSLGVSPATFSSEALAAKNPLDLGTKCTVFMTSRVRHAQKTGASRGDIAAGIAYSVVENALYRIIGRNKAASLGNLAVVQGGTFKSDAVLRAFEKVSGVEAVRPDAAHLMGAWGCALVARERAHEIARASGVVPHSGLLMGSALRALDPKRRAGRCIGCENTCALSIVEFGNGQRFVSGNKCSRAEELLDRAADDAPTTRRAGAARTPAAPNAVDVEQRLIGRFGDKAGTGARAACVVGIMNTLNLYEGMPFWHTLVSELGFSVAVSTAQAVGEHAERSAESIPSESVCQPAKLAHVRYFGLAEKGAHVVLMPRYERGSRCPVSCGYAGVLEENARLVDPSLPPILAPEITAIDPLRLQQRPEDVAALFACLSEVAEPYGKLAREEFEHALQAAVRAQRTFVDAVRRASEHALDWAHAKLGRHAIVLAGRPYHMDESLLHGIDCEIQQLGLAVVPQLGMEERMAASHARRGLWKASKHLLSLADVVADDPSLEAVLLRSFNCLIDAVSTDEVRDRFIQIKRPLTELKIDDIEDTVHIRIRLRTLAEALEERDRRTEGTDARDDAVRAEGAPTDEGGAERAKAGEGGLPASAPEAVDDPLAGAHEEPLDIFAERGIDARDLERARADVTSDLCFTAAALAAHAANELDDHPGVRSIGVPRVCRDCLVDALPYELSRLCGFVPAIEWRDGGIPAPCTQRAAFAQADGAAIGARMAAGAEGSVVDGGPSGGNEETAASRTRVGIVGNPLLVYDPFMNDRIGALLADLDCEVVMPTPERLFVEDVRYLEQLKEYERAGVTRVIYLLSFGCLKGHVQARGALHELARRFPSLAITVVDYDPESSALNRENRVRLAVWDGGNGA